MFQQLGYRGTSVDELCQRCGITKPTLYYYFGNKETLFIQVLTRQLHGFRSILDADRPLVERLTELTQAMLTAFKTDIGSMMRDMEHVKEQSLHDSMNQQLPPRAVRPIDREPCKTESSVVSYVTATSNSTPGSFSVSSTPLCVTGHARITQGLPMVHSCWPVAGGGLFLRRGVPTDYLISDPGCRPRCADQELRPATTSGRCSARSKRRVST